MLQQHMHATKLTAKQQKIYFDKCSSKVTTLKLQLEHPN